MPSRFRGLVPALLAYASWGFFPLYFKALPGVPAFEVLAHRIVWSVVLLVVGVPLLGRWATVSQAFAPGMRLTILASSLLIATNWVTYIWAVQAGRVLEASVGYFVNPLMSVLLGVVALGERLRRGQVMAIGLAGAGVLTLVIRLGTLPWLPLTLALSFGLYGLVRKRARVDAVGGLLAETTILAPVALVFLLLRHRTGAGTFGGDLRTTLLLVAAGPVTALPLVLFAMGMRQLPLSTMGILQYVTPTLQFLLAVILFREPLGWAQALAFAFIWAALAIYTWDSLQAARLPAASSSPLEG